MFWGLSTNGGKAGASGGSYHPVSRRHQQEAASKAATAASSSSGGGREGSRAAASAGQMRVRVITCHQSGVQLLVEQRRVLLSPPAAQKRGSKQISLSGGALNAHCEPLQLLHTATPCSDRKAAWPVPRAADSNGRRQEWQQAGAVAGANGRRLRPTSANSILAMPTLVSQ